MTITLNGGDDIVCQVQLLQASQSVPTNGLDGVMGERQAPQLFQT